MNHNTRISYHTDLEVYKLAYSAACDIFSHAKEFPKEEKYSLTDQIRRSSRSVCANLAEAFRKRRYPKSFIAKLYDVEGEAAETQVWLQFAASHDYISRETYDKLYVVYHQIIGKIVNMRTHPEKWIH